MEKCKDCGREYANHYDYIMHLSYERRKDIIKARAKLWAKNNPEKRKAIVKENNRRGYWRKKRWLENKDFGGNKHITKNDICNICGSKEQLGIHHADGNNGFQGKLINNSPDNLVILCWHCHPRIHNKHWLKDWRTL